MIACAAHLRVYEPLVALDEVERSRWEAYLRTGDVPSRPVQMAREQQLAMVAAIARPPRTIVGPEADQAYVRHVDGMPYVCPWRLQIRVWEALEDFDSQLPGELREAFLPAPTSAVAGEAHEAWISAHPDVRPPILSSTWHIPVPWFALFEADERRLVLGERRSPGLTGSAARANGTAGLDRALVYLTEMSRARRRVPGRCTPSGGSSTTARQPPRSRRSDAGWRSSIRTPWSSSTTAAWCTSSMTRRSRLTSRLPTSPRRWNASPRET